MFGNFVRAWGYGVQTGAAAFEICNAPASLPGGYQRGGCGPAREPAGDRRRPGQRGGLRDQPEQPPGREVRLVRQLPVRLRLGRGHRRGGGRDVHDREHLPGRRDRRERRPVRHHLRRPCGRRSPQRRRGRRRPGQPPRAEVRLVGRLPVRLRLGRGHRRGGQLETCTTASTCQAGTPAGSAAGQFTTNTPTRVAVDSSGSVYTVEGGNNRRVQKFNATASSAADFAPEHASGTTAHGANGRRGRPRRTTTCSSPRTARCSSSTSRVALTDTHAAGAGLPAANGMAVDSASGRIYLSTTHRSAQVYVLGAITPPIGHDQPGHGRRRRRARRSTARVNPNGGGSCRPATTSSTATTAASPGRPCRYPTSMWATAPPTSP